MSQDYTFVFSCRETAFVPALERLRDTLAPQGYAVGPALTRVEVRGDDFFLTECEVPSGGAKGWKTALRGFGEAPGVNLDFTSEALSFELTVAHFPYRHCAVLMSVPMHDCRRLFREEVFGPVLAVTSFETVAQAAALANDTPYGLAASVYTGSLRNAVRLAREIRAGVVTVNCFGEGDVTTPFGGYKESGFGGRDKSVFAHDQYTELKTIWIDVSDRPDELVR